jgi:predicted RNase H-like HicB family nuclease
MLDYVRMVTSRRKALEFSVDIVVEPDGDSFHAFCPALKGLHVDGDSEQEALENATDAAILYLESMIKRNEPIPIAVAETKTRKSSRGRSHRRRLEVKVA